MTAMQPLLKELVGFQSAMQMCCADDRGSTIQERISAMFQSAMQMFCADDPITYGVISKFHEFQSAMQMFCADD